MFELILYALAGLFLLWLCASLAFARLSLYNAILDLPRRVLDYPQARRERKERQRIFEARQARIKAVFDAINRREF